MDMSFVGVPVKLALRDILSRLTHHVTGRSIRILGNVPKLWNDTIQEHRNAVREATLDATAEIVAAHGLLSVTMSQIAERAGIGRATLYKYFPDLEAILLAWHERQISNHLDQLADAWDTAGAASGSIEAVLSAYAFSQYRVRAHHGTELSALLHRGQQVVRAQQQLTEMIAELLSEGAASGYVRGDVAPDELASYCLHALSAAGGLRSQAAVRRLVTVTLAGLTPRDR